MTLDEKLDGVIFKYDCTQSVNVRSMIIADLKTAMVEELSSEGKIKELLYNYEIPMNNEVDASIMTSLKNIIGEAYCEELAKAISKRLRGDNK